MGAHHRAEAGRGVTDEAFAYAFVCPVYSSECGMQAFDPRVHRGTVHAVPTLPERGDQHAMIHRQQPAEPRRDMGWRHQRSYLLPIFRGAEVRGDAQRRSAGTKQGRCGIEARGGGTRDAQPYGSAGVAQGHRRHLGQDREEAVTLHPPVERRPCGVVPCGRHLRQRPEDLWGQCDRQSSEQVRFLSRRDLRGQSAGELLQAPHQGRPPQRGGIPWYTLDAEEPVVLGLPHGHGVDIDARKRCTAVGPQRCHGLRQHPGVGEQHRLADRSLRIIAHNECT